jgi:hypothetical protein
MRKKTGHKLTLNRESLRLLEPEALDEALGGVVHTSPTKCFRYSCWTCGHPCRTQYRTCTC